MSQRIELVQVWVPFCLVLAGRQVELLGGVLASFIKGLLRKTAPDLIESRPLGYLAPITSLVDLSPRYPLSAYLRTETAVFGATVSYEVSKSSTATDCPARAVESPVSGASLYDLGIGDENESVGEKRSNISGFEGPLKLLMEQIEELRKKTSHEPKPFLNLISFKLAYSLQLESHSNVSMYCVRSIHPVRSAAFAGALPRRG
ncbi:hypothetical protein MUK42_34065 [Musa troglodytarum]|uniref:Uncharacterized protein n=1 Tax=Musa troglodytarum TaxID=320322 RepID=A0A9E7EGI4_9LILI|nr:hypothetical protein MUK42_34065 [Musa troglodytarum]